MLRLRRYEQKWIENRRFAREGGWLHAFCVLSLLWGSGNVRVRCECSSYAHWWKARRGFLLVLIELFRYGGLRRYERISLKFGVFALPRASVWPKISDVDVDGVNERRPMALCPYHHFTVYKFTRITHTTRHSEGRRGRPPSPIVFLRKLGYRVINK